MKGFFLKQILLALFSLIVCPVFSQEGKLEMFKHSSETYTLMKKRTISVYLPKAYFQEKNKDKEFPVLYMFDGQNLWDRKTSAWGGWKVETAMENLVKKRKMPPCIIVGISCSINRTKEYAGWCDKLPDEKVSNPEKYKQYAREHRLMIIEEIIPLIESKYRAISHRSGRVIAGSSYGAFLAAHFASVHSDMFCGAGLFSGGSTGFEQIIAEDGFNFSAENKVRFYIDCGTGDFLEKILLPGSRDLKDYLLTKGYKMAKSAKDSKADLFYQECEGEPHNEKAWSLRVPAFLQFMYGK